MVDAERFLAVVFKYLVIKRKEADFAKVSSTLIVKDITDCTGSAALDIRKAEGREINDQKSSKLLKLYKIGASDVRLVPHIALNTIRER